MDPVVLPLRHNGVTYRGVNIITLWMAAMAKGYSAPIWMTFKQAIDLGGCVRKAAPINRRRALRAASHPIAPVVAGCGRPASH